MDNVDCSSGLASDTHRNSGADKLLVLPTAERKQGTHLKYCVRVACVSVSSYSIQMYVILINRYNYSKQIGVQFTCANGCSAN